MTPCPRHVVPGIHPAPTLVLLLAALVLAGCGAKMKMASARMAEAPAAAAPQPPPLDRSLFARDPNGQLGEDALQKILAAPIELELPARVGVIPVLTATDWRGPSPSYQVPAGVAPFVRKLRGSEPFSLVTEIMPIPSGALGMEALREVAARYRLRYVVLYREVVVRKKKLNRVAWGYATAVGALFLPGQQHEVYGYIEATMFDVKTGTLMFTTRRAVAGARTSNVWYQDDKLAALTSRLVGTYAPDLAADLMSDLYRYAEAAELENDRRARVAAGEAPLVDVPSPRALATGAAAAP
ncbi:MAG: hypothetical protein HS111_01140 [Kofleriaceae bacterium]|nr:hypothetical protein [Kofleriaceae bacterium]MCL4226705.1 hypothetical protein [Myxococcales bacterium]